MFVLVALVSVAAALTTAGIAAAGGTACTGTLGAVTVDDNLVVPAGAQCVLKGTHVTGNVTVQAGADPGQGLTVNTNATIDGNVMTQTGRSTSVQDSTIGGNYKCNQCFYADLNGSTVGGNFQDNGLMDGIFASNNTIGGNVEIHTSLGGGPAVGFSLDSNSVGGNFQFSNNSGGPIDISANTIKGNLLCQGNTPDPTGSGNAAKMKQGQCSGL
jgi:hypothetical protein